MAYTPLPLTLTVYDTDNSTVKSGVKAFIKNLTKKTELSTDEESADFVTNSSGKVVIDLANLEGTTPYEVGDDILIGGYHVADKTSDAIKWTIVAADITAGYKDQTLYLNPLQFNGSVGTKTAQASKLITLLVANTDASTAYYAKVYAVADGELLAHVECLASTTVVVPYGDNGIMAKNGFLVERENQVVIVTALFR